MILRIPLVAWPLYLFAVAAPLSVAGGNLAVGVMLVGALAVALARRGRILLPPRSVLIAAAAYLAVHAVADAAARPFPSRWDKWTEEMWMKLLLVAVPVLSAQVPAHVQRAVKLVILVATLVTFYGIWQHFAGWDLVRGIPTYQEGARYTSMGFFGHHLSYGGQLMLVLVFAVAWVFHANRGRSRPRLWTFVPIPLLLVTLVWTYTRSALLGAAAGVFTILSSLRGRRRWLALAVASAVGLMLVASPTIRERFGRIVTGGEETRLNLWESSVRGIAARPWLGFGQGNFPYLMERHAVEGYYEVMGHAHNDFLMHGVNAGLLGVTAALGLLVTVTRSLWRGYRTGGPHAWVPWGGVAAQVAVTVAGLFQVYQTDDEVEMMLYFLLGCGLAILRAPRDGTGERPSKAAVAERAP